MSTELTPAVAQQLQGPLEQVCDLIGADAAGAKLIKYTMNAVFLAYPYVVRLAHGSHAVDLAARTCMVALGLEQAGVPTTRLAADVAPGPVRSGQWVATVWQYIETVDVESQPVDLAKPLAAIHALDGVGVDLPGWAPVVKFRRRLAAAERLPDAAHDELNQWSRAAFALDSEKLLEILHRWCDEVDDSLATVRWQLPAGIIHGDAHTGNLLLRRRPTRPAPDASALLCDLDGICHGPREWDLVPTAHGTTRFGRSRAQYERFADAYGFDITTWSGWPVLSRVRELQLVTSTIESLAGRPEVADQLALRLRSLLSEDDSAVWSRYR